MTKEEAIETAIAGRSAVMTPEQIANAEAEIRKWFPPQTQAETPIWRRALDMLVSTAKAAIPSGQVAEDARTVTRELERVTVAPPVAGALQRLAAQAQSAEVWRKRLEAAANALADVLPGEVGRLDLLARIAELRRQRDRLATELTREREVFHAEEGRRIEAEAQVRYAEKALAELREMHSQMCRASMEHQRQRDAALEEVEVLRTCVAGHNERSKILLDAKNHWADRARSAEARSAQLAAAGQALSAHVDKTAGGGGSPDNPCPCLSDMPVGVERPCHEHDATWAMRDEFAMVAMHIVVTVCKAEIDDGRLNFRDVARRAYGMADEMLKARDAK